MKIVLFGHVNKKTGCLCASDIPSMILIMYQLLSMKKLFPKSVSVR